MPRGRARRYNAYHAKTWFSYIGHIDKHRPSRMVVTDPTNLLECHAAYVSPAKKPVSRAVGVYRQTAFVRDPDTARYYHDRLLHDAPRAGRSV